ncbi:hypothetical protein JCM19379_22730 [Methyloparacoccus murrellii]
MTISNAPRRRGLISAKEKARRERAALRLKERLSSVPFYAQRAARCRARGGEEAEMLYWRQLHGSAVLSD